MLDLGGGADLGAGPALETDDAPARARTRAVSATAGARRATAGTRADSQSVDPARSSPGMRAARGSDSNARSSTLGGGAGGRGGGGRATAAGGERKATSRSGAMPAVDPARASTDSRSARGVEASARSGTLGGVPAGRSSATSRSGTNQVAAGKPAAAPRTGTLGGEHATRASAATSRSGTMRAVNPAPAAAAPDSALAYGRGMMLDDNPFNDAFAGGRDAPALELESDALAPPPQAEEPPPPPSSPPPQQLRARAIVDIAKYGPRPTSPLQQPMYWFHVMNRKRVLSEELAVLSAQRKRTDDQAQETLAALGEALLALRGSPELAALDKQFAAVEDAEHRVGHAAAEGQKRRQGVNQELTRLKSELARAEAKAAPLRERETQLAARSEELKAKARRAETLSRKAEAELEAVRAKGGAEPERWAAMVAERDARLGEFQTLGIELQPVEDDLAEARRTLAVHTRAISGIQDQMRSAVGVFERAEQTQRVTVGSARGARLDALISLANASLKLGLHELVPDHSDAVIEAAERAEKQRQLEELQRAAVTSYDSVAYTRGFNMLLGGSLLLFLSLALAILF
jgi:hypothetical protein